MSFKTIQTSSSFEDPYDVQAKIEAASREEKEAVIVSKMPQLSLNPSTTLSPLQGRQLEMLSEKLKEVMSFDEEVAVEIAAKVIRNIQPERTSFLKTTKKQENLPIGVAIKGTDVFFHEKEYVAAGSFKITFTAFLFDSKNDKMIDIVHQKTQHENFVPMTEQEVALQKQFDHPHIVKIYDSNIYAEKKKIAIYAERCDFTLKQAINDKSLTFLNKIRLMIDVASAFDYVHKRGFSHNDIKPDNILVKNLRGKVSDFGLCKPIGSSFRGFKKIYAPEQKMVEDIDANDKTDVYQFGLVLWHLFHPKPPEDHLNDKFQYPKEMFKDWQVSSNCDKAIQALVFSCLNSDPKERPSTEKIMKFLQIIESKLTSHS